MGALESELLQAVKELDREARGHEITEGDGGRTAQIFRQLRAVARVAGGPWVDAMDEAAEELVAAAGDLIAAEDYLRALEEEMPAEMATGSRASFWDQMGTCRNDHRHYRPCGTVRVPAGAATREA